VAEQESPRPPRSALDEAATVVAAVAAATAALIAIASLIWMGLGDVAEKPPPRSVPVTYAGVFRYAHVGVHRVWCVAEYVSLSSPAFRYVGRSEAFGERADDPVRTGSTAGQHHECEQRYGHAWRIRHRRAPSRGVRALLGPDWTYEGIRGIGKRVDRVYRRVRVEPVALQARAATTDQILFDEVKLPEIPLGPVKLVPDDRSTIRFQGPKSVLRATSPSAHAEDFADEVAFTLRLGELSKAGENPRVAFASARPPSTVGGRRLARLRGWMATLAGWITSLLGLSITTMVTVSVGIIAERRWRARRLPEAPEPRRLVLPDGSAANARSAARRGLRPRGKRHP